MELLQWIIITNNSQTVTYDTPQYIGRYNPPLSIANRCHALPAQGRAAWRLENSRRVSAVRAWCHPRPARRPSQVLVMDGCYGWKIPHWVNGMMAAGVAQSKLGSSMTGDSRNLTEIWWKMMNWACFYEAPAFSWRAICPFVLTSSTSSRLASLSSGAQPAIHSARPWGPWWD